MTDPLAASLDGPWDHGEFTMTCSSAARPDLTDLLWPVYQETFGPLRIRAAARHVLSRDEFAAELEDDRVWKYVALDAAGEPAGLTTLTNDVTTIAWVSPQYYEYHFPDEWRRGAVFYAGVSLVRPDMRRFGVYAAMSERLADRVAAAKGVVAFDVCSYNDEGHGLPRTTERLLNRAATFKVSAIDVQTYYVARYLGDRGGRLKGEEGR